MPDDDTVHRVVARLRATTTGPTASVLRDADRLLRRVEPAARKAARAARPGGSPEQVEDLVQQALEIAWRRLRDFDPDGEGRIESWVRGIVRRVAANEGRRRGELLTADGVIDPGDPAHSALVGLQRDQRDQLVVEAIAAVLRGVEQDVLYHRYLHGLDRDQIAELVGLADANEVRVVMQRAQRRLKAELERRLTELEQGRSFIRTIGD